MNPRHSIVWMSSGLVFARQTLVEENFQHQVLWHVRCMWFLSGSV
jgi:hypothetical protein